MVFFFKLGSKEHEEGTPIDYPTHLVTCTSEIVKSYVNAMIKTSNVSDSRRRGSDPRTLPSYLLLSHDV